MEDIQTQKKVYTKLERPRHYFVIMLNDDYTTQDFVIEMLESVFHKAPAIAFRIMLDVHQKGEGNCGAYTKDIAKTKVDIVHKEARDRGFPFQLVLRGA